jgi:KDO2-lipid IV(A) lauroyltransferase
LQGLDALSKTDLLAAVTLINLSIEALVRRQPGQHLWGYARYKTPRQEPV